MVLQTIHNLSDRETADAVTFDLRWKAACGFAVTETSFHPSVLTYWRRRLAASERPHRIFDPVAEVVAQTGVLAGKRRRAIDSTILDDAVARQVPAAAQFIAGLSGHDYSKPGKPDIGWDDPAARDLLVTALVNDALAVLAHLEGAELSDAQSEVVALLALVAGQDVEPAEGTDGTDGRWCVARKVAPNRAISTVDPEARHAHKSREKKQDGFKAHIVFEPDTGLVTAAALTKASGAANSDAARGAELLAADTSIDEPVEVLADSAFGSGDTLTAIQAAGHRAIIKPMPINRAVPDGFTVDDFDVDDAGRTITCPAGKVRSIGAKGQVAFGVACSTCPLKDRCTTSVSGRKMKIKAHDQIEREHRLRAKDPDFQAAYRQHRPMVERTIAWTTRGARQFPTEAWSRTTPGGTPEQPESTSNDSSISDWFTKTGLGPPHKPRRPRRHGREPRRPPTTPRSAHGTESPRRNQHRRRTQPRSKTTQTTHRAHDQA